MFYLSVTLSINDNIKFLENIRKDLEEQSLGKNTDLKYEHDPEKKNNLCYMIDVKFGNVNSLLVYSFKNADNDPARNYFVKYYMSLVEIKNFNELFQNKLFLINQYKIRKMGMKTCFNIKK